MTLEDGKRDPRVRIRLIENDILWSLGKLLNMVTKTLPPCHHSSNKRACSQTSVSYEVLPSADFSHSHTLLVLKEAVLHW
jgi:hypothetical protein